MTAFSDAVEMDGIALCGQVLLFSGTIDPSAGGGFDAPVGSIYTRTDGTEYRKTGVGNTAWKKRDLLSTLDDCNMALTPLATNHVPVYNSVTGKFENKIIAVPPANSGRLVQLKFGPIPGQSGTTSMPVAGGPAPVITDGTQIWSESITPTLVTSRIRIISCPLVIGSTSSTDIAVAVFRGSTLVGVTSLAISRNNSGMPMPAVFYDEPNTTSATTYSCRIGKMAGGTWYVNSYPGVLVANTPFLEKNSYSVEEIGVN